MKFIFHSIVALLVIDRYAWIVDCYTTRSGTRRSSFLKVALLRKNCIFAGSEKGRQNLVILYSFAATCRKNNVHFRAWLEDRLLKLSFTPSCEIDSLLPHLWHGAD